MCSTAAADVVLVLGDRYETLCAVVAALFARIPVAHIAGGDTTEGAFDEQIRHSITKMAHLHFVTHEGAAQRVRQMGEDPRHVFVVGSPGLDRIRRMEFRSRRETFADVGLAPYRRNLVVAFHPATLDPQRALDQQGHLLEALDGLGPDVGLVMTGSNADPEGGGLNVSLERLRRCAPTLPFSGRSPKACS